MEFVCDVCGISFRSDANDHQHGNINASLAMVCTPANIRRLFMNKMIKKFEQKKGQLAGLFEQLGLPTNVLPKLATTFVESAVNGACLEITSNNKLLGLCMNIFNIEPSLHFIVATKQSEEQFNAPQRRLDFVAFDADVNILNMVKHWASAGFYNVDKTRRVRYTFFL